MTKFLNLDNIPKNTDILGGIDITGSFYSIFKTPRQVPGCLFLLCTQGNCKVTVHLDSHEMRKGSLAIIFPGIFFQIIEKSNDCRFTFLSFSSDLIHSSRLFSYSIKFTPYIFESPVISLSTKAGNLLKDYFMIFIRAKQLFPNMLDREQATVAYTQLILGIGGLFNDEPLDQNQHNRNRAIIKSLIRIIIDNYKKERNIKFYAYKLSLSTQYLSTTVKKMTGKTLTDIISNLVIHDAKAKLRATGLSIQEISDSLNFPDISSFGKYFKRYTGITPTQYRNGID